ncbi:hypothetical protein ADUPG1_006538, partial [Aduncisulcus paluster]
EEARERKKKEEEEEEKRKREEEEAERKKKEEEEEEERKKQETESGKKKGKKGKKKGKKAGKGKGKDSSRTSTSSDHSSSLKTSSLSKPKHSEQQHSSQRSVDIDSNGESVDSESEHQVHDKADRQHQSEIDGSTGDDGTDIKSNSHPDYTDHVVRGERTVQGRNVSHSGSKIVSSIQHSKDVHGDRVHSDVFSIKDISGLSHSTEPKSSVNMDELVKDPTLTSDQRDSVHISADKPLKSSNLTTHVMNGNESDEMSDQSGIQPSTNSDHPPKVTLSLLRPSSRMKLHLDAGDHSTSKQGSDSSQSSSENSSSVSSSHSRPFPIGMLKAPKVTSISVGNKRRRIPNQGGFIMSDSKGPALLIPPPLLPLIRNPPRGYLFDDLSHPFLIHQACLLTPMAIASPHSRSLPSFLASCQQQLRMKYGLDSLSDLHLIAFYLCVVNSRHYSWLLHFAYVLVSLREVWVWKLAQEWWINVRSEMKKGGKMVGVVIAKHHTRKEQIHQNKQKYELESSNKGLGRSKLDNSTSSGMASASMPASSLNTPTFSMSSTSITITDISLTAYGALTLSDKFLAPLIAHDYAGNELGMLQEDILARQRRSEERKGKELYGILSSSGNMSGTASLSGFSSSEIVDRETELMHSGYYEPQHSNTPLISCFELFSLIMSTIVQAKREAKRHVQAVVKACAGSERGVGAFEGYETIPGYIDPPIPDESLAISADLSTHRDLRGGVIRESSRSNLSSPPLIHPKTMSLMASFTHSSAAVSLPLSPTMTIQEFNTVLLFFSHLIDLSSSRESPFSAVTLWEKCLEVEAVRTGGIMRAHGGSNMLRKIPSTPLMQTRPKISQSDNIEQGQSTELVQTQIESDQAGELEPITVSVESVIYVLTKHVFYCFESSISFEHDQDPIFIPHMSDDTMLEWAKMYLTHSDRYSTPLALKYRTHARRLMRRTDDALVLCSAALISQRALKYQLLFPSMGIHWKYQQK